MSFFDQFSSAPASRKGKVEMYAPKSGGGLQRLLPIDLEIMRLLLRAKYVRTFQLAEWLDTSGQYVSSRLRLLQDLKLVKMDTYSCVLRSAGEPDVLASPRIVKAYSALPASREYVGGWQLAGAPDGTAIVPVTGGFGSALGDHTLATVDAAILYRRWGFDVAFEREFKQVEMPLGRQGDPSIPVIWCPRVSGRTRHAPDLGVVAPDGSRWGVEVELNLKPVREYVPVVESFLGAGLGQVWHCRTRAAARNVVEAAAKVGVVLTEYETASGLVLASADGLVRVVRWESGFASPKSMGDWSGVWDLWGAAPPAGFSVPFEDPVDVSASWKVRSGR